VITLDVGTLDVTATDGNINQGIASVITVDGSANMDAGNSITLNGGLNADNTTLLAQNDVTLNGTLDVGTLDVTATDGNITQGNTSVITVDGAANMDAGNSITLNGGLDAGNTTLLAQNDVILNGSLDVGTLDVTATDGGISQGTQGRITVLTGPTNLIAGADITLDQANDFNGTVNASGNNIALNDINDLTLGAVTASGDLGIGSGGNLNQDASSGRGIEVLGKTNIVAQGSVVLGNPNNKFPQGVDVQAASYQIAGDSRKAAGDAMAKVAGSMPVMSLQGIGLSSANAPQPLVMSSGSASSPSASASASGSNGANSSGVTVDLQNVSQQDAPLMVAVSLPKGISTVGTGFSFEMPESVKTLVNADTAVQITQADGSPLPAWLKFDAQALRFEATAVPNSALPMQVNVSVAGQRLTVVISERTE
jgi:hypothetical protein